MSEPKPTAPAGGGERKKKRRGRRPLAGRHYITSFCLGESAYSRLVLLGNGGQRSRILRAAVRLYLLLPPFDRSQLLAVADAPDEIFSMTVKNLAAQK